MNDSKERIVAVGAGRMGRGIAQVFAYAGHPVTLLDFKVRPKADAMRVLDDARAEIAGNLAFLASLGVLSTAQAEAVLGRVTCAAVDTAAAVLTQANILFEGVPEVLSASMQSQGRICGLAALDSVMHFCLDDARLAV
jgi:3-hydroxybutyryl-CoA dehydrogenase